MISGLATLQTRWTGGRRRVVVQAEGAFVTSWQRRENHLT